MCPYGLPLGMASVEGMDQLNDRLAESAPITRSQHGSPPNIVPVLEPAERWLAAGGVLLAPLLVLVLPQLVFATDYSSAEEQFRAIANGRTMYGGLLIQIAGAICLVPAVLGTAGVVLRRGRGTTLGLIGVVIGLGVTFAMLLVLGIELAQHFIASVGRDKEAAIALALALNEWPVFGALLITALIGLFLTLLISALALWRACVVPVVVPALFLLPLLVVFIPLPGLAAVVVPTLCLLVPCLWMSVQLARTGEAHGGHHDAEARALD